MAIIEDDLEEKIHARMDPEKLEAFCREGEEALEEYEKTGLHITNKEFGEWVKKLRKNPKEPMPKCHK